MIANKGARQLLPTVKPQVPRGERPAARTSAGLRNALFDEIDALRRGDGDPQKGQAIAKLAMTILYTAKLEHQAKERGLPASDVSLVLGDDAERNDG